MVVQKYHLNVVTMGVKNVRH